MYRRVGETSKGKRIGKNSAAEVAEGPYESVN
jgi:hypothetical protein